MQREETLNQIRKELAIAEEAQKRGNTGMVRVCARRAAGAAIEFWLESNPREGWGPDVMSRLRNIALDDSLPLLVRDAARRLSAKATELPSGTFTSDPIQDCRSIIDQVMGIATPGKQ